MSGRRDLRIGTDYFAWIILTSLLILIVLVGPVAGISVTDQEAPIDTDQKASIQDGNELQNVITVGENGTYSRLQNAVKNANRGDTIQVESGTYYQIHISKQITIIGIDTGGGKPVIDGGGSGPVVEVAASGVTIDGFHITNMGENAEGGVKTVEEAHDLNLANTTFSGGDIALNLRDKEMGHRIYLNDFSGVSKTLEIAEDSNVKIYWNTSKEMTYWWNGEQISGKLGNYYGERVIDSDGDGVGEEPREMGLYPWQNSDFAPLVETPWKYFEKGAGSSNTDAKTLTSDESDGNTFTDASHESQEQLEEPATTPKDDSSQNSHSVEEDQAAKSGEEEERQRGFFSNSGDDPDILSNALNLTVIGFLLSVAGILQQMMGGR